MTNNLHCHWCGAKMRNDPKYGEYYCTNTQCKAYINHMSASLYYKIGEFKKARDALIIEKTTHNILQDYLKQYQKALNVAVDALKQIQWFCYAPTIGERAQCMQQCADKTLKEIAQITSQED